MGEFVSISERDMRYSTLLLILILSACNVGAWSWWAESNPNSVGFVCIPHEGHPACN